MVAMYGYIFIVESLAGVFQIFKKNKEMVFRKLVEKV